jgi:hypothetical protein
MRVILWHYLLTIAEAQKQEAMQAAEAGSQAMANMGKAPQQVQDSIGDAL